MTTRAQPITRAHVLAYRVAVHDLEQAAAEPAVLLTGVQDNPPGRTAGAALGLRGAASPARRDTVLVHSARAAMHLHLDVDVDLYASALRFEDGADLAVSSFGPFALELAGQRVRYADALDEVAAAMRDVMADGEPRTKGELSGAVTPRIDRRLAPWCGGCGVHHANDALFRYGTLQADLHVVVDAPTVTRFHVRSGAPTGDRPGTEVSRREVTRRFLRLCGPATHQTMAIWLGIAPAVAKRMWGLVEQDLVAVEIDSRRAWMHQADLDRLGAVPGPTRVRLLPPYDPVTELADREFLVPDRTRRRDVWRAATNPGVLLARGELMGTWRQRAARDRLTITVRAYRPLTPPERHEVNDDAATLGRYAGLEGAEVHVEEP